MLPGLPTVTVSRLRYPTQVMDATTGRAQTPTPATLSIPLVIEEPWKANGQPPRPDGLTSDDTRLFVSPVAILGVEGQGTATPRRPDRIVSGGVTWQVAEVVIAPAMPGIPAAWHAYCTRVRDGDEP